MLNAEESLNQPLITEKRDQEKDKPKPQAYLSRMFQELNRDDDDEKGDSYEDRKKKDLYKKLTAGVQINYPIPACRAWLRHLSLKKSDILFDIFCGITVGMMIVPESMAFAQIAGLPLQRGVYSIIMPLLLYSIFGTCRHLSPGPVSVICLLVGEALSEYEDINEKVEFARTLCFTMGVCLLLFGLFKLGFIENLLSRPMIHGFLSGLALYILCDQLYKMYGIQAEQGHHVKLHNKFEQLLTRVGEANKTQLSIALVSMAFLYVSKYLRENCGYQKSFFFQMSTLWVLIAGTIVVFLFELDSPTNGNVRLMKEVPDHLHGFELPELDKEKIAKMLPLALMILISGYVETLALTKRVANQKKYVVDFNMEMVAHGICNIVSPCFGAPLPSFGAISRTVVTVMVGGKTNLNTLVVLAMVFAIVYIFYPIIRRVPVASVNSIVFFTVSTIIDVSHTIHYIRYHPFDFIQFFGAFFFAVYFDVDTGLIFCLLYSIFSIIRNSSFPSVSFQTIGSPPEQELKSKSPTKGFSIEKFVEQLKEAANHPQETSFVSEKSGKQRHDSKNIEAVLEEGEHDRENDREENTSPKAKGEEEIKKKDSSVASEISVEESEHEEEDHHHPPFEVPVYRKPLQPKDVCFCINTKCRKRFHILVIKIEKVFFFANAPGLKTMLEPIKMLIQKINKKEGIERENEDAFLGLDEKTQQTLEGPQVRAIVFDCSRISYIDTTALEILNEIIEDFKKVNILVKIAEASPHKRMLFEVNHFDKSVARESDRELDHVLVSILQRFFDVNKSTKH